MARKHLTRTNHISLVYKGLRKPLWVSLALFVGVTLILATVLHFSQKSAGTVGLGNWWSSLWWLLAYYLGLPVKVADYSPDTVIGQAVVFIAGFIKLLIFAVLTGYFITLIRERLRSLHLKECENKILRLFRRRKARDFGYLVISPYEPLASIEAQLNIKEEDVIDTVMASPELRLRNLADGELRKDHPNDRLVVERFPVMNTQYGCRVYRGSLVTIVCPTAISEPVIGNFSWYVAQFEGFNYISREVRLPGEEDISYYKIKDPEEGDTAVRKAFLDDINRFSKKDNSWTVILISDVDTEASYHYVHGDQTGNYKDKLDALKGKINQALTPLGVKFRQDGKQSNPDNLENRVDNPSRTLTIRLSYRTTLWKDNRIKVAFEIAKAIHEVLDRERQWTKEQMSDEIKKGYTYKDKPIDKE